MRHSSPSGLEGLGAGCQFPALELGLGHCHRTASIWSDSAVTGILKSILHPVTAGKSGVLGLDAGWKSVLVLIKLVDFRHHAANYGGSHFPHRETATPFQPRCRDVS